MEAENTGHIEKRSAWDARTMEELFRTHYAGLCSLAVCFLKDRDEAEEIVQELFCQLWEKKDTTTLTGSVKSYLYTSVRNSCLNRIKHLKMKIGHREHVIRNSDRESDQVMQRMIGKELEEEIEKAMDSLPDRCGIIFRMSRQGNLKYSEIAENLDISVKTVENQMGKALRILREKLKNYLSVLICISMTGFM